MDNKKYNGFVNYATWRISLELIDLDYFIESIANDESLKNQSNLIDYLEEHVDDYLEEHVDDILQRICWKITKRVNNL